MKRARTHWFLHETRPQRGGLKIYFPLALRLLPAQPKPCTNTAHTHALQVGPILVYSGQTIRKEAGKKGGAGSSCTENHKAPETRAEQKASPTAPSPPTTTTTD